MEGVRTRIITAALTAVMILNVIAPIPSGFKSGCDFRYGTAEANTAVAMPALWGTLVLGGALYLSATTDADYAEALQQTWDSFIAWNDSYGGQTTEQVLSAISGATIEQRAINLGALGLQFWQDFSAWAAWAESEGLISSGSNSLDATYETGTLQGVTWRYGEMPSWVAEVCGYDYTSSISQGEKPVLVQDLTGYYMVYLIPSDTVITTNSHVSTYGSLQANCIKGTSRANGTVYSISIKPSLQKGTTSTNRDVELLDGRTIVDPGLSVTYQGNQAVLGAASNVIGVASQALLDGYTAENAPTGTYDAFSPTAAQLEEGYDYSALIEAIESGTEVATDISGSVLQILTQVTGLTDVFGDLRTQVQTLVTDFASQLAWAGAESFPNVMNTVIDGLGDIAGGIEAGVSDLLDGIAAVPGADVLSPTLESILAGIDELTQPVTVDIPAVLEGVQEGVLSIPDAMEIGLENVIASINAQTLEITGALEGVNNFGLRDYDITQSDGTMFALPVGMAGGFMESLEDKVPFCYVLRSESALNSLFNNLNQGRSFYFDIQLPYTDEPTRFDAEPFLSVPFGLMDIATTIKVAITAFLCLILLWRAYKVIERMAY